jgi:cyclophilin family peptidyl-prolyl cis-trans isomerase/HEAT repeat protein
VHRTARVTLLAVALAALVAGAVRAANTADAMRAIAIAEDQRRWSDGELKSYLASDNASVRARAVLAVGRIQDTTSVDALIGMLDDPSTDVRREATFALGQLGRGESRPSLVAQLIDSDGEVIRLAVEALGKLGDKRATDPVVAHLDARMARVRQEAAVALWRIADTTAAGALIAHLPDPDPEMRWRCVYALEKLPMPHRIVPAVSPLLFDPSPLVRAHAARTLGRQKSRRATVALLGATRDADPMVTVNAIRALASIADSSSTTSLAALTADVAHADPLVRVTAATALADAWAWMSAPAVDAAAARGALERALGDPDAATRGAAGRALVTRFGAGAWEKTAERLEADASPYVRTALLEGLRGWLHDASAPGSKTWDDAGRELMGFLSRRQPLVVRMTAADVAGGLGKRHDASLGAVRETLRAGLRDPDALWASACAGALGDWGDAASVRRLAAAYAARVAEASPDARQAIRDALRQLAGRAFADSVERAHPVSPPPVAFANGFELPPREKRAVVRTSLGDIEWELLARDAPQTVRNFVVLARQHYFDGSCFHRVVPDFVIQDGDPTGTGSGGPGYTIRCEYNDLQYEPGMVGMALSGKDTGGSQWFITLSPQPHLNGRYTIFARVTKGLDVARKVTQGTVIEAVEISP